MAEQIIAVIGAGGKTTAMKVLAAQNRHRSVLVTTTTHIFPFEEGDCRLCLKDPTAEELAEALCVPGIVCAGSSANAGKLGMLPPKVLRAGIDKADLVIYEGDGAHLRPLKLHRENEPVILPETTHCLIVAGLSALGRPVGEAVHRFARNPDWTAERTVTAEELRCCILETIAASGFSGAKIFLNQTDTLEDPRVPEGLQLNARWGSLREYPEDLFQWLTED